MLHCSRRKQHRRLADCIHTSAGGAVPLSDNISLGEVSSADIDRVIRLNKRLKELKLPFYAVCGRGGNPSFRRTADSCVDEKNIAYITPKDLSKRLQKNYGISLEALRNEPLDTLRKKVEEKMEELKAKQESKQRKTADEQARPARLRRKKPSGATVKSTDPCAGCESPAAAKPNPVKPNSGKPNPVKPQAKKPIPGKPKQSGAETEQQKQERIAQELSQVAKVLENALKKKEAR